MAIKYSDGADTESRILALVKAERAERLGSDHPIGLDHYADWPTQYHLCPERGNLLRHLDFTGLDVLELGAGMGAVSRGIAERAKSLTVIEGTEARFAVLSSRLRNLKNWTGQVANIQDATLKKKFDVVCVVGVLEYSELYVTPPKGSKLSPFACFLKKAASWLKPDGVLILAIENRLGIKYWAGAAEDHTGRLFDGICGYPLAKSPKTFSRQELLALLGEAGLGAVEEQFPFPDYKVPTSVLTRALFDASPEIAAALASGQPYRNYGQARARLYPELLTVRGLAQAKLLPEMANSFLFLAAKKAASPTLRSLLRRERKESEIAWHYSNYRRIPTMTAFAKPKNGKLTVSKSALRPEENKKHTFEGPKLKVTWSPQRATPAHLGVPARFAFANRAFFEGAGPSYALIKNFVEAAFSNWEGLGGRALDAIFTNATLGTGKNFPIFDLEWEVTGEIPKSWFLFKNALCLAADRELLPRGMPFETLHDLYVALCRDFKVRPDLDGDIRREAEFQNLVALRSEESDWPAAFREMMHRVTPVNTFAREPRALDRSLGTTLKTLPRRLARRIADEGAKRVRGLVKS